MPLPLLLEEILPKAAINACHAAATKQLRAQAPQADRVQFLGHQLTQPSTAETAVSGTGQYLSRNGSTWTKLSYVCTYSTPDRGRRAT